MKTQNKRKKILNRLLRKRPGGLNFFELVISLIIIAVTSVAVASSFYTAYNQLNRQRWKKKAVQLLKAEADFWMGRVHSQFPSPFELQHPIPNPDNPIQLDPNTPQGRSVLAELYLLDITGIDMTNTEAFPDWYEIRVSATYEEPALEIGGQPKQVSLQLVVPFIRSVI